MVLTDQGWIHNSQITYETLIANWNPEGKLITFERPSYIIHRNHKGKMIIIKGSRLDIKVTPNHVMAVYNRDLGKHVKVLAKDLKEYVKEHPNSFIPTNGFSENMKTSVAQEHVDKLYSVNFKDCGFVYKSFDLKTIELIATENRLRGSSAMIHSKLINGKVIYQTVSGSRQLNPDGFKIIPEEIQEVDVNERVWCVTVPTSHVVVKRNFNIFIAGNCHSVNARKLGIDRDAAKSFSYATMYGAQPAKLAKMLRIPLKEAERLYEAYWEAVPALKDLKDRLEAYWKKTGKQYIMGIDGRKLYVRSQHSLVNLLLQSAGALCVKYTIVNVCQRLEELGVLGDPLLDTEEDMASKYYLMIVYHKLVVVLKLL